MRSSDWSLDDGSGLFNFTLDSGFTVPLKFNDSHSDNENKSAVNFRSHFHTSLS